MTPDQICRPWENFAATGINPHFRRSVRLGIWKRLLWRFVPAVILYLVLGSVLLEAARRILSTEESGFQSPLVTLTVTAILLCPFIVYSAKHLLALAVNLELAHLELLSVLSKAIAARDDATEDHNLRVAIMAVHLATAVGLDRQRIPGLFIGALMHDVGKIAIPDSILLKPGKLSTEEQREMEQHVRYGDEILASAGWPVGASHVVHFHHERFDGSGYPEGKKGNEIPPEARLFAIVDVFDALTAKRPYKEPLCAEEALLTMETERGTHFDPSYLDAFKKIAEDLYARVACIPSERLGQVVLELIERHYASGISSATPVSVRVVPGGTKGVTLR